MENSNNIERDILTHYLVKELKGSEHIRKLGGAIVVLHRFLLAWGVPVGQAHIRNVSSKGAKSQSEDA